MNLVGISDEGAFAFFAEKIDTHIYFAMVKSGGRRSNAINQVLAEGEELDIKW